MPYPRGLAGALLLVTLVGMAAAPLSDADENAFNDHDLFFLKASSSFGLFALAMADLGAVQSDREEVRQFARDWEEAQGHLNRSLENLERGREKPMWWQEIHYWIGSNGESILWWQMSIRAALIFFYALFLIRLGSKRIFGKNTSFDIVLSVILGSILSRTLTANAEFYPTLAAAATLVLLHMAMAFLALGSHKFGHLIKGKEVLLVKDGAIHWPALRRNAITVHDLEEAARSNGSLTDIGRIRYAYLERSGNISIISS